MEKPQTPEQPQATIGSVTFLEPPEAPRRRERVVIGLLVAITVLLAGLVIGLSLGTFWLMQQSSALQAELRGQAGSARRELAEALATTQALTRDLLQRQAALSNDLKAQSDRLAAQQKELDRRRNAFGKIPADPFTKADYAIGLTALALDEARIANRHLASTQAALAKNMGLTPAQQKLLADLKPPSAPK